MQLKNKSVVITGAGSGIGQSLAISLSHKGANLILCGRRIKALEATKKRLAGDIECHLISVDVTNPKDRKSLVASVTETFGKLDMLINNAGIVIVGSLAETSDNDLQRVSDVNLVAPMALARDFLPLLKQGTTPCIVNIGSMFGDIAFPLFTAYSATKFGLRGFSDALRRELAPNNIAVTYVAPRATKTPAAENFSHLEEGFGMTFDTAEKVASYIVKGIEKDKTTIYPKGVERIFTMIQRICPKIIDKSLIKQLTSLN